LQKRRIFIRENKKIFFNRFRAVAFFCKKEYNRKKEYFFIEISENLFTEIYIL